ncbi:hypothetical protein D9M72_555110 [compost metagenome]
MCVFGLDRLYAIGEKHDVDVVFGKIRLHLVGRIPSEWVCQIDYGQVHLWQDIYLNVADSTDSEEEQSGHEHQYGDRFAKCKTY